MLLSLKKYGVPAGIIVLALLAILLFKSQKPEIINLNNSGTDVVAFGDSLVKGVGASDGRDFVTVLSERIGEPIVNLGVSGNTTSDGLARIDQIFEYNPKVVIVLLGGNDYLKRVPMEETFSNLSRIVKQIQGRGSAVLLLGIRGGLLYDSYDDDFADFAREHGVAFVPNVLDELLGDQTYMSDQIHPNSAGYLKVADKVEPVLREILGSAR